MTKYHHLALILSLLFFVQLAVPLASAAAPGVEVTRDISADTLLQPVLDIFKAMFDLIKSPFVALQTIINNWVGSVTSAGGIWAPVLAVIVLMSTVFVVYAAMKMKGVLP